MWSAFPVADCVVCAANSTEHGWLALAVIVLAGSLSLAVAFAWLDGRKRTIPPDTLE